MARVDASAVRSGLERFALAKTDELGEGMEAAARATASRRSGALADGVKVTPASGSGTRFAARLRSEAEHGLFRESGTGVYGPTGAPIRPRSGRALVFDWPAAGGMVAFASVAGSPPDRWWSRALEQWPQVVREAGS